MLERKYQDTLNRIFAFSDSIQMYPMDFEIREISPDAASYPANKLDELLKTAKRMDEIFLIRYREDGSVLRKIPFYDEDDLEISLEKKEWKRIRVTLTEKRGLVFGEEGEPNKNNAIPAHRSLGDSVAISAGNMWFDEKGDLRKISHKSRDYLPFVESLQFLLIETANAGIKISSKGLVIEALDQFVMNEYELPLESIPGLEMPPDIGERETQVFIVDKETIDALVKDRQEHYKNLKENRKFSYFNHEKPRASESKDSKEVLNTPIKQVPKTPARPSRNRNNNNSSVSMDSEATSNRGIFAPASPGRVAPKRGLDDNTSSQGPSIKPKHR